MNTMKKQRLAVLLAAVVLTFAGCSGKDGHNQTQTQTEADGQDSGTEPDGGDSQTEAGGDDSQTEKGGEDSQTADAADGSGADTDASDTDASDKDAPDQETLTDAGLFELAVQDSVFAEEEEILPLVTLTKEDERVSMDEKGRVLLCTWHNYPDSYPEGETVKIEWGPVWTFTDREIEGYADELAGATDVEMRLRQLIAFAPDSEHSTVTGFWVKPADVLRPAYQSDPTDGSMTTSFGEDVDEDFKEWFDENILGSYFYGSYPWTRLGYTYDWADNGSEYGLSEFIVKDGAKVKVEFTETTEEFLGRIAEAAGQ